MMISVIGQTLQLDQKYGEDINPSQQIVRSGNNLYRTSDGAERVTANGQLTHVGHESTRGKSPRNFGLDPTGNYLLVANHGSNDIYVFRVDKQSGLLDYTGYSAQVPTPVCLKMIPIDD